MRFESMSSKKFEDFKQNEIFKLSNLTGGKILATKSGGSSTYNDCWDDSTGNDVTTTDGNSYDRCSTN